MATHLVLAELALPPLIRRVPPLNYAVNPYLSLSIQLISIATMSSIMNDETRQPEHRYISPPSAFADSWTSLAETRYPRIATEMVHAAALPCSVITALATTLGLQKGTAQTSAMWHGNSLNMMMRNC